MRSKVFFALLIVMVAVCSCGVRGKLYLPDDKKVESK